MTSRPLVRPAPTALLAEPCGSRVTVVTGTYGDGHNAAGREIARVLGDAGADVTVVDVVDLMPWGLGRLLRSAYYAQLRWLPDSWTTTLEHLEPGRRLHTWSTRALRSAARPVAHAAAGSDLVISTHPFASQALGHARRSGLVRVPAVTYLTDTSVHAMWVHPDIDLHLAIHDLAARQAVGHGGRATTIRPLVPVAVRAEAGRRADPLAGLEIVGPAALVTGGSLGIGELEQAARDIAATGVATPVVLCGTNGSLRSRLAGVPGVVALGWRDDVADLLASVSCVVQNAGGFTSLEALASGAPVISYRPIPGHGLANCAHLEQAGLVPWARTPSELRGLLVQALDRPRVDRLPAGAPSVLEVLTGSRERVVA
ncbi:MAG: galactosyldiacylglycerol synthase [Nocardioides sp.]|uniref:MGDG synthase family glycosyltransferase n=1 Tax=Nocardioides sp. TaxID=35761 RepID=UPI0039E5864D